MENVQKRYTENVENIRDFFNMTKIHITIEKYNIV